MPNSVATQSELKNYCFSLLSRREYSRLELAQKLAKRSTDNELIESLLNWFVEEGYQSDQRFAETFVRSKREQGQGPCKIQYALKSKGIDSLIVEAVMPNDGEAWRMDAALLYDRKFKGKPLESSKEKSKRFRFMVSRGFSPDQIVPLFSEERF